MNTLAFSGCLKQFKLSHNWFTTWERKHLFSTLIKKRCVPLG